MHTPTKSRRPGRATWLALIILLAVWFEYIDLLRASWPFVTDDMYISLRYASSLADGFGLAWNRGDGVTVEGFSNLGFVALAAAALRLDLDPVAVLRGASVAGLSLATVGLWQVARRHVGPVLAVLPALLLLGFPGTAWWGASGLETGAFVGVVVAAHAVFLAGLERRRRAAPHAAIWRHRDEMVAAGHLAPEHRAALPTFDVAGRPPGLDPRGRCPLQHRGRLRQQRHELRLPLHLTREPPLDGRGGG